LKYIKIHGYQLAVDKLEGLVVQRLFELTKANASETGYKLRTHIAKAIKTRSKAIQRALNAYNNLAVKMDPPRPKLSWTEIVEYSTIAEFELLRIGAREDIRNLEWAKTRNREATVCQLKTIRAEEEIHRLNVEVKRLATWIEDEMELFSGTLEKLIETDPLLYEAMKDRAFRQERINNQLRAVLHHISALNGFTGTTDFGERFFPNPRIILRIPARNASRQVTEVDEEDIGFSSADEELDHVDQMYEGIMRISIPDE
ncbi:hypothetical protein M422DRAFT_190879, partial [Sphaerobolus stellatus SS14]